MASADPLLPPCRLTHPTLKNRIVTTGHDPADPGDGAPGDRYRADHGEGARGGAVVRMRRAAPMRQPATHRGR